MGDIVERLREDARGGMAYHELSDEAADEIERLREAIRGATVITNTASSEIKRLRKPYRCVDRLDWEYLIHSVGDGGRGRFWKAVIAEIRAALVDPPA